MGGDRTSTGDQDRGTDQGSGGGSAEECAEARVRLIRRHVIGWMFLISIGISVVVGLAASKIGMGWSVLVCVFGGLVSMFCGMGIEWIRHREETDELKGQFAMASLRIEDRWKKEIRRVVENAHRECNGFAIETARAVANRVANRIIARHAKSLLLEEQREATLKEADQIVDEELGALQAAVQDESESARKN